MGKAITRRQRDLYFVAFDLLHLNGHEIKSYMAEEYDFLGAERVGQASLCSMADRKTGSMSAPPLSIHAVQCETAYGKRVQERARPAPKAISLEEIGEEVGSVFDVFFDAMQDREGDDRAEIEKVLDRYTDSGSAGHRCSGAAAVLCGSLTSLT